MDSLRGVESERSGRSDTILTMSIIDLVREWDEAGELDTELKQLAEILDWRGYTRAEIINCFETLMTPWCLHKAQETDTYPTLDEFRAKVSELYSDRVLLLTICKNTTPRQR